MSRFRKSGLWAYLEERGVLDGSPEEIKAAKKEYRRQYNREYMRKRRKGRPEITLSFEQVEIEEVKALAKQHHQSLSGYIREATLAYGRKTYLVPNPESIAILTQQLSLWRSDMQRMVRLARKAEAGELIYGYKLIMQKLTQLEEYIETVLRQPKSLAELLEKATEQNPDLYKTLLAYLQTQHDHQN